MTKDKIDTARFRYGVLTLSDKGSRGERQDSSGPALRRILDDEGYRFHCYEIIPDRVDKIRQVVSDWIDRDLVDLVVTTGGTGVAPSDVTPEAMEGVIEKEIPGMAEAMRMESLKKTPHAMLSRAKVGIRGNSLIINLPGSERGARENLEVVIPALPHALDKIQGGMSDCGT
ncbi:MAG: MogA/MoaB family molybdenum cofactor biosynthesis protein [Thermodesulfobacteriota bacterium]